MISVCMASYNGEKYIEKQIQSILPQLGADDELVISDDGSTDKTIEIIKAFNDGRIKLFYNNGHDYTRNFENALRKSKGDIIFLCDQDDIWMPNKLQKVARCFEKTNCDLVVTDAKVVDTDGNIISESYFKSANVKRGFLDNWLHTRYIGSCIAFKRRILERVLPIPGNSKYIAHDYWIVCIGELYYKVVLLNEPLMCYVRHEGVTSPGISGQSKLTLLERVYKRFYTIVLLFARIYKRKSGNTGTLK